MELFAEIVNGWKPFAILAKSSILDVWLSTEYTPTWYTSECTSGKKSWIRIIWRHFEMLQKML